jgi:uncharacterized membrane protein
MKRGRRHPDLTHAPALARVAIGTAAGLPAGALEAAFGPTDAAPLVAWDALALTYICLTWWLIWPLDSGRTAHRAVRPDRTRAVSYVLLISATLASLVAVGIVLFQAGRSSGTAEVLRVALGVGSIVVSWTLIHTVYTLRYATTHYGEPTGAIRFNQPEAPSYRDFAYLAFTIGMTLQVSDTPLTTTGIRRTALLHALTSYLLATMILAAMVNLVAGLSR